MPCEREGFYSAQQERPGNHSLNCFPAPLYPGELRVHRGHRAGHQPGHLADGSPALHRHPDEDGDRGTSGTKEHRSGPDPDLRQNHQNTRYAIVPQKAILQTCTLFHFQIFCLVTLLG